MEPFHIEVERLGWARWQWTGWDDGDVAIGRGVARTEAGAERAAHVWMRGRFESRVHRRSDVEPSSATPNETVGGA